MTMMPLRSAYLLLGYFLNLASAQSQEGVWQDNWKVMPGTRSSDVALMAAVTLISSTGHSWPDGRQVIVTFWRSGITYLRCIDYFDRDMISTGGICFQPIRK
jgi:hypothetical protein